MASGNEYHNFSNAPFSIGELRSAKERDSGHWAPREALVSLLRDIDSHKIDPASLIIVYDTASDDSSGYTSTYYVAAVKGFHKALGLLTYARWLMMEKRP